MPTGEAGKPRPPEDAPCAPVSPVALTGVPLGGPVAADDPGGEIPRPHVVPRGGPDGVRRTDVSASVTGSTAEI